MPQQRGEETRARILDAAVRKFAIAGYDAASVDDICAEAGVSKGAFLSPLSDQAGHLPGPDAGLADND